METKNADTKEPNELVALSEEIGAVVEHVGPAIVAIDARPRVRTSGVIWRPGIVVSTSHTIRRDEEITAVTDDGKELSATLLGRDPGTDLAVLRVEGANPNDRTRIADAAALKVGHLVLAVGRTDPERGVNAGLGIVSVLGEKWRTWRGGEIDRLIRPDVSIFIGFSGGALVNVAGEIVGINTTGLARGAGLTIPATTVDRVVDQVLKHGHVARPYLGIGMHPVALPDKLREKIKLAGPSGLILLSVEPGAPADLAGLALGDILIALDGAPTANTDDVQAILAGKEVGNVIKAAVLRGGEVLEREIALGDRPGRKE
jgi:serine protease DegQ